MSWHTNYICHTFIRQTGIDESNFKELKIMGGVRLTLKYHSLSLVRMCYKTLNVVYQLLALSLRM
jgi:hypothetical protein